MAKHAPANELPISSKKARTELEIQLNTAAARADITWKPLGSNRLAAELREDQGNPDTVYEPWCPGQDRDGNEERPKEWKFYDPVDLPVISSGSYHDSAGVNGFPVNVILGDRAVIAILNAKTPTRSRAQRWPADFTSQGRVHAKRIPRGLPAFAPDGSLLAIHNSGFSQITLKGNLSDEQADQFAISVWNTISLPPQELLRDYVERRVGYNDPPATQQGQSPRPNPSKNTPAPSNAPNSKSAPASPTAFTKPLSTKELLRQREETAKREEVSKREETAQASQRAPAESTQHVQDSIYYAMAMRSKQEHDRSMELAYTLSNSNNKGWVEAFQADPNDIDSMRDALRNIRSVLSHDKEHSLGDMVAREIRRGETWSRFHYFEVLELAKQGHRADDIKRFRLIDPVTLAQQAQQQPSQILPTMSEEQRKARSAETRNKHRVDGVVQGGYVWQARAGPSYDLHEDESE